MHKGTTTLKACLYVGLIAQVGARRQYSLTWHMYNNAFLCGILSKNDPHGWHNLIQLQYMMHKKLETYHLSTNNNFETFASKIEATIHSRERFDTCRNRDDCKPLTTKNTVISVDHINTKNSHIVFSEKITQPVGWLRDSRMCHKIGYLPNSKLSSDFLHDIQFHFIWLVVMDTRVHSTIHFKSIVIPTIDLYRCSFSHVRVYQDNSEYNSKHNKHFKYCGLHSNTTLYCPSRPVWKHFFKTEIFFLLSADYQVDALFTISNCPFYSKLVPPVAYPFRFQSVMYKANAVETWYIHHVVVKKNCGILFATSPLHWISMTVHDGPGILSPVIQHNNYIFHTTTFQCVVLYTQNERQFDMQVKMEFLAVVLQPVCRKFLQGSLFSLTLTDKTCCLHSLCTTKIQATQDILIRIHKVVFTALDKLQCLHGGFSVWTEETELWSICEPHDSNSDIPVNVFSSNTSAVLILYWYPEYSNLSVLATAELTNCKGIVLDPCVYRVHCPFRKSNNLNEMCSKYILQHKTSQISLSYYSIHREWWIQDHIVYKPITNSCIIIQIKNRQGTNVGQCSVHIEVDTVSLNGYLIHNVSARARNSALSSPTVGIKAQGEQFNIWKGKHNIEVVTSGKYHTQLKTNWQFQTKYSPVESWGLSLTSFLGFVRRGMVQINFEGTGDDSQWMEIQAYFTNKNATENNSGDKLSPVNLNDLLSYKAHPLNVLTMTRDGVLLFKQGKATNNVLQVIKIQSWTQLTGPYSSHLKPILGWMVHKYSKSLEEGYEVSLPGLAMKVVWSFNCSDVPPDTYLINGRYKEFQHILDAKPETCENYFKLQTTCQSYSNFKCSEQNMTFLISERKVSSFEALALCYEIKGHLPVFPSKDELEEFLALVKTHYPSHIEGIFVGLNITKQSQVRNFFQI